MVDLRERVEADRGILKKIQAHFPGFSGYRKREDIRIADSMLRIQLADRIDAVRKELESCRNMLVENYMLQYLEKLGNLVNKFKTVEGEVRHAEQGYSGFGAAIQIREEELDKLYEYDYAMVSNVVNIQNNLGPLKSLIAASDNAAIGTELAKIRQQLEEFETNFKRRMKVITGTEVI